MFIRPAGIVDVVALAQLFVDSVDQTYITPTEEICGRVGTAGGWADDLFQRVHRELAHACTSSHYLVMCLGVDDPPEFLGYTLTALKANQCAEVEDFVISPNARGQGFGKALNDATLAKLKRRGFKTVFYEVGADNERMHRFLRSAGMAPGSIRYSRKL